MRLCIFLLIAGLLDAILTHLGITFGVIQEGNPLIAGCYSKGVDLFLNRQDSATCHFIGLL